MPVTHLPLPTADLAAWIAAILIWAITGRLVERPPARHPSVSALMTAYRHGWMQTFLTREPRIFDATVVDSLRQGTAFFASATMIAIGGLFAMTGNTATVAELAGELGTDTVPPALWTLRLIPALFFVTDAFLNFVWAHRLFGYCAIIMASTPNDPADPAAADHAVKAAGINIHAAKNFNRGLRSVYFGIGALLALLSPLALGVGVAAAAAMILRREFWSHSRDILLGDTQR